MRSKLMPSLVALLMFVIVLVGTVAAAVPANATVSATNQAVAPTVIRPWKAYPIDMDGDGCRFRIRYSHTSPKADHINITRAHVDAPLWTADYYQQYAYDFQAPAYSRVFTVQKTKVKGEFFRADNGDLVTTIKVYVPILTDNPTC